MGYMGCFIYKVLGPTWISARPIQPSEQKSTVMNIGLHG